jgi:flavodoxin
MKTLIIYDSVFGNTEKIAQAIGSDLGSPEEAGVFQVNNARLDQLTGAELLIVGSPTRGFKPTPAITDFLKSMPTGSLEGVRVAAFDTRLEASDKDSFFLRFIVKIGGYAASPIAALLKKKGGNLVVPPEGFFVLKSEGPLREGELERAAAWAKQVDEARKLH